MKKTSESRMESAASMRNVNRSCESDCNCYLISTYLAPELDASVHDLFAVGVAVQIPLVRVLVADDFAPWRRLLHTILREKPELQVVCEVSDGLEAVQKARELQPDLILLDIGLPTLSGIEAARRIRSIAPKAKILFVSE